MCRYVCVYVLSLPPSLNRLFIAVLVWRMVLMMMTPTGGKEEEGAFSNRQTSDFPSLLLRKRVKSKVRSSSVDAAAAMLEGGGGGEGMKCVIDKWSRLGLVTGQNFCLRDGTGNFG